MAVGAVLLAGGAAQAQSANASMVGTWRGSYVCLQGQTGLTLSVTSQQGDRFSGFFHFYPPRGNPAAKEGCYSVEGRRDSAGAVTITAGAWITRPEGYVTVDLRGRIGGTGFYMTGDVIGPAFYDTRCRKFELNWHDRRPQVAPVCRAMQALAR